MNREQLANIWLGIAFAVILLCVILHYEKIVSIALFLIIFVIPIVNIKMDIGVVNRFMKLCIYIIPIQFFVLLIMDYFINKYFVSFENIRFCGYAVGFFCIISIVALIIDCYKIKIEKMQEAEEDN